MAERLASVLWGLDNAGMGSKLPINRVVSILTAVCGLGGALVVPLGNLDWTSTAGVLGGLAAIVLAAQKWLTGWQAHEARLHLASLKPAVGSTSVPVPFTTTTVPAQTISFTTSGSGVAAEKPAPKPRAKPRAAKPKPRKPAGR